METKNQNFVTKYIVSVSEFAEDFLQTVAKDYDLCFDELKKRYLCENHEKFSKKMKKLKRKKSRKVTPYNIFLSDKHEMDKLLKKKKTENQTKINREKGNLWEVYKNDKKIMDKYNTIAAFENKNLITKHYRRDMVEIWDEKQEFMKTILNTETEMYNVLKKLNIEPIKPKKSKKILTMNI